MVPIMASAALGAVEVTVGRMSAMDLFRLLRNCEEELLAKYKVTYNEFQKTEQTNLSNTRNTWKRSSHLGSRAQQTTIANA